MAFSFDAPFCLTPVSADGRTPVLSPHQGGRITPVRLVCSISAISAVVHAILTKRIEQGDELRLEAVRARRNGSYDLAAAALVAPAPRISVDSFERAYYSAQFSAALSPPTDCPFTTAVLPDISMQAYITRLLSFSTTVSNAVYILMIGLLDKAVFRNPGMFLHSANAHRLVLAAFVIAAKYHEDCYIPNADFARFGGVTLEELNVLEKAFLDAIDWRCMFSKERFEELEGCIIQESLDTARGLSVFQTLRAHNIGGIDDAVRRTRSWSMGDIPMSPVGEAAEPAWLGRSWVKSQGAQLRLMRGISVGRGIVGGVAHAVLQLNYPEVPMFPITAEEQLRHDIFASCYPRAPRNRLFHLQTLASAIDTTATVVPTMFDLAVPLSSSVRYLPRNTGDSSLFARDNAAANNAEYGNSAKASVHFLLNDLDPFEDLNAAPIELPAPCSMMAIERECGLEGLLQ